MSFGVAEGEQPRFLRSLGIRPPPSCTRPALLYRPQEGPAAKVWLSLPSSPPPFPRSPACRKPPAKCPAGTCGQMPPRSLAGGTPAPPEVSGPDPSPSDGRGAGFGAGARPARPEVGSGGRKGCRASRRGAARWGDVSAARGRRLESEPRGTGRCRTARGRAAAGPPSSPVHLLAAPGLSTSSGARAGDMVSRVPAAAAADSTQSAGRVGGAA